MLRRLLAPGSYTLLQSLALLALRLAAGGSMALAHGWGKLMSFSERSPGFPDPIGIGNATSMSMAIFSELVCGALIAVGLLTRLAAVPAAFTMAVAFLVIHGDDPYQKKELALMYFVAYAVIFILGPGRLSVDRLLERAFAGKHR